MRPNLSWRGLPPACEARLQSPRMSNVRRRQPMQSHHKFAAHYGLMFIISFFACDLAIADAIIPYMVVPWGQVFLLPLVICLEAVVLWRFLHASFKSNLFQSFITNLVSTALGAVSYILASGFLNGVVFEWWFKGGFSKESIRSAIISFGLAVVLWIISWTSESVVIAQLRKKTISKSILIASAWANVLTYVLLLVIAVSFGRAPSSNIEDSIDYSRTSNNVASTIQQDPAYPMVGFWKASCSNDFGLAIEAAKDGKYSIVFCGPGACGRRDRFPAIDIQRDPHYRILDANTIEELPAKTKLFRCLPP
jgi:hypothetical protein